MQKKIVFLGLLFLPLLTNGQILKTKLDFIGGVGYPEYFHAGIRYKYYRNCDLGFYYGGGMGISNAVINTWNFDHLIHFGQHSYLSNKPVWYARQGFTRSVHTTSDRIYKYSYINLGAGRDINITSILGFNIDMGAIIQVREKREFRDHSLTTYFETRWIWKPLVRLQLNISI